MHIIILTFFFKFHSQLIFSITRLSFFLIIFFLKETKKCSSKKKLNCRRKKIEETKSANVKMNFYKKISQTRFFFSSSHHHQYTFFSCFSLWCLLHCHHWEIAILFLRYGFLLKWNEWTYHHYCYSWLQLFVGFSLLLLLLLVVLNMITHRCCHHQHEFIDCCWWLVVVANDDHDRHHDIYEYFDHCHYYHWIRNSVCFLLNMNST